MKIAKQAVPISLIAALAAVLLGLSLHPWLALPPALFTLFTLWFFRDPERIPPDDPNALISPADGKVIRADAQRISIFMNVFNVHICRAPIAGTVVSIEHSPGRFLAAYKDAAADHNERTAIVIDDGARRVRFVMIAGLIARRIVCTIAPGQQVAAGERVGLIQFGSRVDVHPDDGCEALVRLAQRVTAGETIIARRSGSTPPPAASPAGPP